MIVRRQLDDELDGGILAHTAHTRQLCVVQQAGDGAGGSRAKPNVGKKREGNRQQHARKNSVAPALRCGRLAGGGGGVSCLGGGRRGKKGGPKYFPRKMNPTATRTSKGVQ